MSRSKRALAFGSMLASAGFAAAAPALAHINLLEPAPRVPGVPDSTLSRGPCGQRENARLEAGVHVFRPGESIDVVWEVYVQHVSYFRIAFDADGDDSFSARRSLPRDPAADDPTALPAGDGEIIFDYIEDRTGDIERVEQRVALPDVECERCTLQVIQFTYGLPIDDATYHQCADLVLDDGDGIFEAPASGDGPSLGAGDPDDADGAGCSLAAANAHGASAHGAWLAALVGSLALALAARRSRREVQGAGSASIH
jgi:hypothetical protein